MGPCSTTATKSGWLLRTSLRAGIGPIVARWDYEKVVLMAASARYWFLLKPTTGIRFADCMDIV